VSLSPFLLFSLTSDFGSSEREPIPERPSDDDYEDPPSEDEQGVGTSRRVRRRDSDDEGLPEEDELGEGDEAPQIVVLREGKDLSKDEARKVREGGGEID
jgi:hypothetical protein